MILDDIIAHKKEEVAENRRKVPLSVLKAKLMGLPPTRPFAERLKNSPPIKLIAEIKKASPSRGVIREDFNPIAIAQIYEKSGASAISVLTDERFFQGHLSSLRRISYRSKVPLLRKDFIIDEYQIYESRLWRADAILLIVSVLGGEKVANFIKLASDLGLDCLVEVHNEAELEEALRASADIVGINNRNLKDFTVDLNTTFHLLKFIPENKIVVSESGISTRDDVLSLEEKGVNAILVGEALMREADIQRKVEELLGVS